VTYTPDPDFNGTDTFDYTASDGNGGTDTATVTVTVDPVNDAPVAQDDAETTDEDTPVDIDVLANDTDADGDSMAVDSATDPANGSVVVNLDDTVTYTPDPDFNGTDTFDYTASDGNGGTDTATVTVTVDPVNDAPVCVDLTRSTNEDTPADIAPSCTDVEGSALTYAIVAQPSHGTASVVSGQLRYTPASNYNGGDSFTYKANDGTADSNVATVTITVNPVNDAPVAVDDAYDTAEDTTLAEAAPGVLGNDTDEEGDSLTAGLLTDVSHGTLTLNANGSFEYVPDSNYNGGDSFTYKANDGTADSNVATVTITVNPDGDLTFSKTGNGTGTVTSDPAGINCGPSCTSASATYPLNTPVTLTASPSTGSVIGPWEGCDPVPGNPNACTLTMTGDKTVAVRFCLITCT
jgi:large repetitive protein